MIVDQLYTMLMNQDYNTGLYHFILDVPPRGLPPSGVLPGQTVLPAQPVQKV